MLVLSRRIDETLVVDDDITFTVLSINGNQVRIGIKAPPSIAVHREEIHRRLLRESDRVISFSKSAVNGTTEDSSTHANHFLPSNVHYQDGEVKGAVNQRKAALRKKYGNLPSLQAEA